MSNTVFSVSLDALTMAMLEEIKTKYPKLSRNATIKRIIKLKHIEDHSDFNNIILELDAARAYIKKYQDRFGVI
tara:strand:- start:750 stop:971 length:222 start_codon:yes stop_codon:yes gene_type:complete